MKVYKSTVNNLYYLMCPACKVMHAFGDGHGFDGNYDSPTIQGSLGWTGESYAGVRYCHSVVTKGMIEYAGDSEHEFKSKTLELPQITQP